MSPTPRPQGGGSGDRPAGTPADSDIPSPAPPATAGKDGTRSTQNVVILVVVLVLSGSGLAVAAYFTWRSFANAHALGEDSVETYATVLSASSATSAQGMRSTVVTYEFDAPDPATGATLRYRRSTGNAQDVGPSSEGRTITIRYRPEDPSISGLVKESAGGGNTFLMLGGLLFLVVGSVYELVGELRKPRRTPG